MKRILLDENVPRGLARLLVEFDTKHIHDLGWAGVDDTQLLSLAVASGFDVLVTADQNLSYQQNLKDKTIGVLALSSNNWTVIQANVERIRSSLDQMSVAGASRLALEKPGR